MISTIILLFFFQNLHFLELTQLEEEEVLLIIYYLPILVNTNYPVELNKKFLQVSIEILKELFMVNMNM